MAGLGNAALLTCLAVLGQQVTLLYVEEVVHDDDLNNINSTRREFQPAADGIDTDA